MRSFFLLLLALAASTLNVRLEAQKITIPSVGMHIKKTILVAPGHYSLPTSDTNTIQKQTGVIIIEGKNIVLDLAGVVLDGADNKPSFDPNQFTGIAIEIKPGSSHITIKNATIKGYKIGIKADSVEALTIDNCDLSYNYRDALKSNFEKEDEEDWMSYHQNETDEWMRYGAGIYIKKCKGATITNNTVTNGQCGLMLTSCNDALVTDNNFSFNSGIGIGLYKSCYNNINHNQLDFNVRGYHYKKYRRGQDSAAILVFEQCNHNIFAYNSATHSGDGFFLWAGQTTMDTGLGGCNDNFIYGNDFSYAPTNGVEVTFSSNLIMKNTITNCDHGVWGGYSFETDITDNIFSDNRIAIAIEHGQNINIALNNFKGDKTGIKLWSRATQPSDWKYPQFKNTDSKNYWIATNSFENNNTVYDIMGTDSIYLSGNTKTNTVQLYRLGERIHELDSTKDNEEVGLDYAVDKRLQKVKATSTPLTSFRHGLAEMRITNWGPYNFEYPLIWLTNIDSAGNYHFEVLGNQAASWRLHSIRGFTITDPLTGVFPATFTAMPTNNLGAAIATKNIIFEYTGPDYKNIFGETKKTGSLFKYNAPNLHSTPRD
jgi:nitrous oxidase accessory protein NosD